MAKFAAATLALLALSTSASAYTSKRVALEHKPELAPATLPKAEFVLPLSQKVARPSDKAKALRHITRKKKHPSADPPTAIVAGSGQDEEYITDITIGGQTFKTIIGTRPQLYSWSNY